MSGASAAHPYELIGEERMSLAKVRAEDLKAVTCKMTMCNSLEEKGLHSHTEGPFLSSKPCTKHPKK